MRVKIINCARKKTVMTCACDDVLGMFLKLFFSAKAGLQKSFDDDK